MPGPEFSCIAAGAVAAIIVAMGAGVWGLDGLPGSQPAAAEPAASNLAETAAHRLFVSAAASDTRWTISEVVDPDEALFDRNDIGRVRIAASESTVRVRAETADGQPFEFANSAVIVQFYWYPDGEPEANYVQASIGGPVVNVIRLDTQFNGRPTFAAAALSSSGSALEFELPRAFFRRAELVTWLAESTQPACGDGCAPTNDWVPHDGDSGPYLGEDRPQFVLP